MSTTVISRSNQPAARERAASASRRRLALAAGAVLALALWGASGGGPEAESSARADRVATQAAAGGQPAFDGRGKWTGYAR